MLQSTSSLTLCSLQGDCRCRRSSSLSSPADILSRSIPWRSPSSGLDSSGSELQSYSHCGRLSRALHPTFQQTIPSGHHIWGVRKQPALCRPGLQPQQSLFERLYQAELFNKRRPDLSHAKFNQWSEQPVPAAVASRSGRAWDPEPQPTEPG